MTLMPGRIRQPVYEIWGIFQFLLKNKNHINCIFFRKFMLQRIYLKLVIFGKVQWNPVWLSTSLWVAVVKGGCSIWDFTGLLLQNGINRLTAPSLGSPAEKMIVTALSTMLIDSCLKELYIFHRRDSDPFGPWFHSNWRESPVNPSGRIRVWDFCCKLGLEWIQTNIFCPLLSDNLIDDLTEMVCMYLHPLQLLKCSLGGVTSHLDHRSMARAGPHW